ncbi:MAG: hypothetical protein AMXMBFR85_04560 [Dehalococcoides mccartyi]
MKIRPEDRNRVFTRKALLLVFLIYLKNKPIKVNGISTTQELDNFLDKVFLYV